MNRSGVIVPVAALGIIIVIAQGWMDAIWQKLYDAAHVGSNPGQGIQSPASVIQGIPTGGSDIPMDPFGHAVPNLTGTFNPSNRQFTANNPRIGTFQCDPSSSIGCIIPQSIWSQLAGMI